MRAWTPLCCMDPARAGQGVGMDPARLRGMLGLGGAGALWFSRGCTGCLVQEAGGSYGCPGRCGLGCRMSCCFCPQALIPLSLEGTEVGQTKAAQALAKITITSNPEMAFPGERVSAGAGGWVCQAGAHVGAAMGTDLVPCVLSPQIYEVVRPLVSLLHLQRTGLENFEGLMALTNLAGISERLR